MENQTSRKPLYVIEPSRSFLENWQELWAYRELVVVLVARNIKARYRQMALGWLWLFGSPIINVVVVSIIFGQFAKLPSDGIPYPIFAYSALLPWTFFSSVLTSTSSSLVVFMPWMSKVYFPRLIAPVASIATRTIDWIVLLIILVVMMLIYHIVPGVAIVTLPLFLLIALIVGASIGLWTATISVKFRDISSVIEFGLTFWYYLTPALYSDQIVPGNLLRIYQLNPMYWVIQGFRWALLGGGKPPEPILLVSLAFFVVLFITGALVFNATSRSIVDLQ